MNVKELIGKYEYLNHNFFRRVDTSEVLRDLQQLDEPQKVKVPQFVADWIEYLKKCSGTLYGSTAPYSYYGRAITDDFEGDVIEVLEWIRNNSEVYARAWLDGYEVEKEKRYRISMPRARNHKNHAQILCEKDEKIFWCGEWYRFKTKFTRKELEEAGFGWVFDCEGIEVEEVTE